MGNVKIGPSFLKLFLDIFIFIRMVMLIIGNRYDVVHAHEEAVFLAFFLKKIFRFKLIYDMHSSLPQQLSNFNFTTSKLLINIFKKLEDASLRAADAVITICPDLRDYVNTVIDDKSKHFLIENSIFDKVRIKNKEETASMTVDDLWQPDASKKIVIYAGTLEKYQGIDILVSSFKKVSEKIPEAHLLIVGGTPEQVKLYHLQAEKLGLTEFITFTGRVPQEAAKHYNQLAAVLTSPRSAGTNTPLKVYEQLASGKPVVATDIYSHTQVLTNDVAFLVEPKPEALADGIISALQDSEQIKLRTENARKLYEEKYSRKVYSSKLSSLLEMLK